MTATLPPCITASTGMDTLCHAIEAASCLQRNPVSDAFAEKAIGLVSANLMRAVEKGGDKAARPRHGKRQPAGRRGVFQQHGGSRARHRPRAGGACAAWPMATP